MTLVQVETNRDIDTVFGLIASGSTRYAAPSLDGRWLVYMWLPSADRRGRAVLVPPEWIFRGKQKLETAERQAAARADYEHARHNLGWSNDRAVQWLADSNGLSLKRLREWGFDTAALESAERRERERQRAS